MPTPGLLLDGFVPALCHFFNSFHRFAKSQWAGKVFSGEILGNSDTFLFELFYWDLLHNLTLSHFLGQTSKKKHPVQYVVYIVFSPKLTPKS